MMLFVDPSIILALFLFLAPASSTVPEETSLGENGYDCGRFFFTDEMIKIAIREAFSDSGKKLVIPYIGSLYDRTLGLYTWPLIYHRLNNRNKLQPTIRIWRAQVYQVVFTEYGEAIDVIVKITNNDFARCWRIENSQPKAQWNEVEQSNGYLCGQKFIPNEDLLISCANAANIKGQGKDFPAAYTGHLYAPDAGFLIWPIYRGQVIYKYGVGQRGPYYIVIDQLGQLQDVIVQTVKQKSFVRCIKSRKDPSPPDVNAETSTAAESSVAEWSSTAIGSSDPVESSTAVQVLLSGFMCNHVFFSDNDLEIARDLAMKSSITSRNNIYPKIHDGYPFDTPCLFWPIRAFGSPYGLGRVSSYRLVLTLDYQILTVVMESSNIIKMCERKTITNRVSYDDKNNYHCGDRVFTNYELLSAAKIACQKKNFYDTVYPRLYEEDVFEVEGPYLIYPLLKGKVFKTFPGKNFLVMNFNCIVAGALTKDPVTQKLTKCIPI